MGWTALEGITPVEHWDDNHHLHFFYWFRVLSYRARRWNQPHTMESNKASNSICRVGKRGLRVSTIDVAVEPATMALYKAVEVVTIVTLHGPVPNIEDADIVFLSCTRGDSDY